MRLQRSYRFLGRAVVTALLLLLGAAFRGSDARTGLPDVPHACPGELRFECGDNGFVHEEARHAVPDTWARSTGGEEGSAVPQHRLRPMPPALRMMLPGFECCRAEREEHCARKRWWCILPVQRLLIFPGHWFW